jgi:hypothetical protein
MLCSGVYKLLKPGRIKERNESVAVPADCTVIGLGRSPEGRDDCVFFIRTSFVDRLQADGPAWKFNDLKFIPATLKNPHAIYEGLNREEYRDGCGYCVQQSVPSGNGNQTGSYFFIVYVQPMSGGFIVLDFAWRPEDPHHPGRPTGWRDFERGQVWPKT